MQTNSAMCSKKTVYLLSLFIFLVSFFYYPKFQKTGSEATISWDVSGYYWYLPAIFIYKDVKLLSFSDSIMAKYSPTTSPYQYFKHRSGHNIMKYTCGQALQYLPFFLIAHLVAPVLGYPADGFSIPYQFAIQFGSLLMCFLGLWYLRKILLHYFSDKIVMLCLAILILATNYLNYAAIDNAMSHNWLFTWYCLLIWTTIKYYQNPTIKGALFIGFIVGICALTRPTEVICAMIPVMWGMKNFTKDEIKGRLEYLWLHKNQILMAGFIAFCVVFIQLAYYRYAGQEWLIYAYQDQGFSWFHPHFKDYVFSIRSGWLVYTPIMILSIIGMIIMVIKRSIPWLAIVLFTIVNTYIVVCWDVWWYGGRAMIQSYPILLFGVAILLQDVFENQSKIIWKSVVSAFLGICIYYNIWWTHQVHLGGLIDVSNMSPRYLARVIGRWSITEDVVKLYDTNKIFEGERKKVKVVYTNNFDNDPFLMQADKKYGGSIAEFVNAERQFTNTYTLPIDSKNGSWLRATADYWCEKKEWESVRMTQLIVSFKSHDVEIKRNAIKLYRFLDDNIARSIYFDVKLPNENFSSVELVWWNTGADKELIIDNLVVEQFEE